MVTFTTFSIADDDAANVISTFLLEDKMPIKTTASRNTHTTSRLESQLYGGFVEGGFMATKIRETIQSSQIYAIPILKNLRGGTRSWVCESQACWVPQ